MPFHELQPDARTSSTEELVTMYYIESIRDPDFLRHIWKPLYDKMAPIERLTLEQRSIAQVTSPEDLVAQSHFARCVLLQGYIEEQIALTHDLNQQLGVERV